MHNTKARVPDMNCIFVVIVKTNIISLEPFHQYDGIQGSILSIFKREISH